VLEIKLIMGIYGCRKFFEKSGRIDQFRFELNSKPDYCVGLEEKLAKVNNQGMCITGK
jgi:hypothetical protein